MKRKLSALLILFSSLVAFDAWAAMKEYKITIKNHIFIPQNIDVAAGEKVKLIIENQDKTIEEFDSRDLGREKIIGGGKSAIVYIGPLQKGVYHYEGEFNAKTAKGTVSAK